MKQYLPTFIQFVNESKYTQLSERINYKVFSRDYEKNPNEYPGINIILEKLDKFIKEFIKKYNVEFMTPTILLENIGGPGTPTISVSINSDSWVYMEKTNPANILNVILNDRRASKIFDKIKANDDYRTTELFEIGYVFVLDENMLKSDSPDDIILDCYCHVGLELGKKLRKLNLPPIPFHGNIDKWINNLPTKFDSSMKFK